MISTDEIRAKLDELGIEYRSRSYGYKNHVWWDGGNGVGWHAENRSGVSGSYVKVDAVLTPEQAIAATVGARTCHMKLLENVHARACQDVYECDQCGERVLRETCMGESEPPKFCPNCGARVVSDR